MTRTKFLRAHFIGCGIAVIIFGVIFVLWDYPKAYLAITAGALMVVAGIVIGYRVR